MTATLTAREELLIHLARRPDLTTEAIAEMLAKADAEREAQAAAEHEERQRQLAEKAIKSAGLTERDMQVLRLVAEGKTDKCIASELCLGFQTVRSYRKTLNQKIDTHSPSETARWYFENVGRQSGSADPAPSNTAQITRPCELARPREQQ